MICRRLTHTRNERKRGPTMGNPRMFKGGPSLNPGGRPRVAALLDGLGLGPNCKEAFEFIRDVMRGDVKDPQCEDRNLEIPITVRVEAAKWLAEKRTGKAPSLVDVEH